MSVELAFQGAQERTYLSTPPCDPCQVGEDNEGHTDSGTKATEDEDERTAGAKDEEVDGGTIRTCT